MAAVGKMQPIGVVIVVKYLPVIIK